MRTLWFVEFIGSVEDKVFVAYSVKQFTKYLEERGKVLKVEKFKVNEGKVYRVKFREFPFYLRVIPGRIEVNPFFLKDVWIFYEIPPLSEGICAFPVFDTELWIATKNEV